MPVRPLLAQLVADGSPGAIALAYAHGYTHRPDRAPARPPLHHNQSTARPPRATESEAGPPCDELKTSRFTQVTLPIASIAK